jgi:hypothetical protein
MHTASKHLPSINRLHFQATNDSRPLYSTTVSRTTRPIGIRPPRLTQFDPFLYNSNVPIVKEYRHIHTMSSRSGINNAMKTSRTYVEGDEEYDSGEYKAEDSNVEYEEDSDFGYDGPAVSADKSSDSDDHDFIVYSDDGDNADSVFNSNDDISDSASDTSTNSQCCSDNSDVSTGDADDVSDGEAGNAARASAVVIEDAKKVEFRPYR